MNLIEKRADEERDAAEMKNDVEKEME